MERSTGDARREAFQRLVRLLAVHETAEEEIVHPYARRVLPGGVEVVDDRLEEERKAKELLQHMDEAGVDDPDFMTNLERLRLDVLAHARAEERYEFVQLRAHTSEAERRTMAAGVKAAEAMAPDPTRTPGSSRPPRRARRHADGDLRPGPRRGPQGHGQAGVTASGGGIPPAAGRDRYGSRRRPAGREPYPAARARTGEGAGGRVGTRPLGRRIGMG